MRISPTGDAHRRGFTLLEVLIVLAIMGLLSAVALPLFARTMSRLQMTTATRDLLADLGHARQMAFTGKNTVDVLFHVKGASYIINDKPHRLPVTLDVVRNYRDTKENENAPVLRFFPDGSASPMALVLSSEGHKTTIRINWLTGRAQVTNG